MAFTTKRGRPPAPKRDSTDSGTPELRLKHALGLTAEPIDLCLERRLISEAQHRSGLHLRWLYTLRYGAPSVTTRYVARELRGGEELADWRAHREHDYLEASRMLKTHQYYEPVMRLAVYNERPSFLSQALREAAWHDPQLATELEHTHRMLTEGLELLVQLWTRRKRSPDAVAKNATFSSNCSIKMQL